MIHKQILAAALTAVALQSHAEGEISNWTGTVAPIPVAPKISSLSSAVSASASSNDFPGLRALIAEALENNPEIQAALREREAASHRISPAEALDDPVLEAGVINTAPGLVALQPRGHDHENDWPVPTPAISRKTRFAQGRGGQGRGSGRSWLSGNGQSRGARNQDRLFRSGPRPRNDPSRRKKQNYPERIPPHRRGPLCGRPGSQADALKAQTQVSRMPDELLRLAREQTDDRSRTHSHAWPRRRLAAAPYRRRHRQAT